MKLLDLTRLRTQTTSMRKRSLNRTIIILLIICIPAMLKYNIITAKIMIGL